MMMGNPQLNKKTIHSLETNFGTANLPDSNCGILDGKLLTHWPRHKWPHGLLCVLSSNVLEDTRAALVFDLVPYKLYIWVLLSCLILAHTEVP